MSDLIIAPLEPVYIPLANKLYKTYYPAGKTNKADNLWYVKQGNGYIGLVKYREYESWCFLSGLMVVPAMRGKGVAIQLLEASLKSYPQPIYCFAFPYLVSLYQSALFEVIEPTQLPVELQQRFERYTIHGKKNLVPMRFSVAKCE